MTIEWTEPPVMETGAPMPAIIEHGTSLFCAYLCSHPDFIGWDAGEAPDHAGFDEYCALTEFEDVRNYKFGHPSDEELYDHPLYDLGVSYYGFYKLNESPELDLMPGYFLWVAAFHDETLQVIARSAKVLNPRIDLNSPEEALNYAKPKT